PRRVSAAHLGCSRAERSLRMQCRRVRGFGRVRRRLQLPLLELSCADRSGVLPVGRIERDKLTVTKGAESLLVEGDPDSTYEVRCGECFSLLYWTARDGYFGVPYGTLIDEPTLKPMYHQFVGSKAPWYEILDE